MHKAKCIPSCLKHCNPWEELGAVGVRCIAERCICVFMYSSRVPVEGKIIISRPIAARCRRKIINKSASSSLGHKCRPSDYRCCGMSTNCIQVDPPYKTIVLTCRRFVHLL